VTDFLNFDDLLAVVHASVAPGQPLIRDVGLLESALARPQASAFGVDAYPSLHEKAAGFMESLARNHALVDGNKRLAWIAVRLFLELNNVVMRAPDAATGDAFVRKVATGELPVAAIAVQLRAWSI
jgi:death-on-curing protein